MPPKTRPFFSFLFLFSCPLCLSRRRGRPQAAGPNVGRGYQGGVYRLAFASPPHLPSLPLPNTANQRLHYMTWLAGHAWCPKYIARLVRLQRAPSRGPHCGSGEGGRVRLGGGGWEGGASGPPSGPLRGSQSRAVWKGGGRMRERHRRLWPAAPSRLGKIPPRSHRPPSATEPWLGRGVSPHRGVHRRDDVMEKQSTEMSVSR